LACARNPGIQALFETDGENMAGYSGTPLVKKLGIKEGHQIALLGAPDGFARTLGELPKGVVPRADLKVSAPLDVILFFAPNRASLTKRFEDIAGRLSAAGGLWIAWQKKASGVATDLSENDIRDIGLSFGLVDNKVCAVDDTWSGLRFVRRLKDR
jgi:hypothetical protein